ncbi:MAG TPA: hypothetical protein DEQ09_05380 [Bacteroidales bacterium]|nr:hypothetical protein [Bacteroidales bacterium]
MNRFIYFFLGILLLINTELFSQDSKCSKPKVNVILSETFHPENRIEVYDHFQNYYTAVTDPENITPGFEYWQTEEDFYIRIQEYIFQTLQEYNPDVEFVSNSTESGEYKFEYFLTLYAIDVVDPETGIPNSKTGYNIGAKLTSSDVCESETRIIKSKMSQDLDLFQAIKNMAGIHIMNIGREIMFHEQKYMTPPRGPRMETEYKSISVSPLVEDRKTDVRMIVYNCKDESVYSKNHGQKIFCPKKTERGENSPTRLFLQNLIDIGDILTLMITRPHGASLTYELKKGVNAGKETFEVLTCGRDKKVLKKIELNINGLEINVKPEKRSIKHGDKTSVDIYFNLVSPDGKKKPVAGKELSLSVKGLVDGSVTPSRRITTDSKGKGTIQYKAGDKDEKITITASYQPVDYPDKVTGSGSVNIIPDNYAWIGTIELEITETYNCDVERQTGEISKTRTMAGDHKRLVADILIGLTDFDLLANGTSAGAKLQYLSGQVTLNMSEDHTINGNEERHECHNDGTGRWEWVSPGSWSTNHETMAGQAYRDINLEETGLNLLITKKSLGDKSAVDDMQQQLAELQSRLQKAINSKDMKAVEQIKGEMQNMMQGDQSDASIPILARFELSMVPRDYPVYTTYERKIYNVCTGDYKENESRSETLEMPILTPFGAQMEGMYTRDENGNDRIDASINDTNRIYKTFGSGICPEATVTVKGSIYLERRKE